MFLFVICSFFVSLLVLSCLLSLFPCFVLSPTGSFGMWGIRGTCLLFVCEVKVGPSFVCSFVCFFRTEDVELYHSLFVYLFVCLFVCLFVRSLASCRHGALLVCPAAAHNRTFATNQHRANKQTNKLLQQTTSAHTTTTTAQQEYFSSIHTKSEQD